MRNAILCNSKATDGGKMFFVYFNMHMANLAESRIFRMTIGRKIMEEKKNPHCARVCTGWMKISLSGWEKCKLSGDVQNTIV